MLFSEKPKTMQKTRTRKITNEERKKYEKQILSAAEYYSFKYLLEEFPTGVISLVSDTYNIWYVLSDILPALKELILSRDGKLVIRPDSGTPEDIICGKIVGTQEDVWSDSPEELGVVEMLWNVFGGTINEQGYKVLDPHVGTIYGDSITLERAEAICQRLADKGFASTNVVLGIGSFSYNYVSRDTFSIAMKATWCEVDGKEMDIFKSPITDSQENSKKSLKGRLTVFQEDGTLKVKEMCSAEEEASGLLETVFENGTLLVDHTLAEIRARLKGEK